MQKRILLIGYNFHPEPTGIGKYSGEMMAWLAKNGYDCEVITSYPYYPYWKVQEPYYKNRFGYTTENKDFGSGSLKVHRCPMYVPQNPSGLKRIIQDFSFLISALFKLIQLLFTTKFDLVVTVAPSFQFGLLGIIYKKLRNSRILYHIQDMQIEAARDLQMIKSDKIINTLFKAEKYIFQESDFISSISEGMIGKIEGKAKKKVQFFPNWVDTAIFYPLENKEALKVEFGFSASDKVILYSGAIGEKQGLDAILKAAEEFQKITNLKFIICGSGPYKTNLQKMATDRNLNNVIFFPLQPFEKFNKFLNMADVHMVIQKGNASDLVMPSKLTTILAVGGTALITANKGSSLYNLVDKHEMGILVDAENQEALNYGIALAVSEIFAEEANDIQDFNDKQPADISGFGNKMTLNKGTVLELSRTSGIYALNARKYAEKWLSIESVMKDFVKNFIH